MGEATGGEVDTRVAVVDAQPLSRLGIRALVEGSDLVVVGETGQVAEAARVVAQNRADVVVVGIGPPEDGEVEVVRLVRQARAGVRVLVVSTEPDEDALVAVLGAGAVGFLLRTDSPDLVLDGIRAARDGRPVLSPSMTSSLVGRFSALVSGERPVDPLQSLTEREREVLTALGEGASNKDIAAKLFISHNTVKNHVHNILDKLGLSSRTEAALMAAGVIRPGGAFR